MLGTYHPIQQLHASGTITIASDELREHQENSMLSVFEELESDIVSRLGVEVSGHVKLLLEVMKSAARVAHEEYFLSHTFAYHCRLLGLDHEGLQDAIAARGLAASRKGGRQTLESAKKGKDEIREQYMTGKYSKRKLAAEHGIATDKLTLLLDGFELPEPVPLDDASVIADRDNGMTFRAIEGKYRITSKTIYRILRNKT